MSSIDKINVGGVDFDINSSPTPVMAPVETGTTATQPYAVGDYVIVGSTLHEVTAAIAIGGTFTEGTNISTSTSLGDEIKEVKDDLSNYSVNTPLRNVTYYNGKLYQITSTGQRGSEIIMNSIPKYVVAALGYGTVRQSTLTHVISNNTTKTSNVYHGQLSSSAIDTRYLTIEANTYYAKYTMVKDALFYPNNEPVPVVLKAGKSIQIGYTASGSNIDAATGTFAWVE